MINEVKAEPDGSTVRRRNVAVMVGILSEANKRVANSSLGCKCKLSAGRLEAYLDVLKDMGLLSVDSEPKYLKTTKRGHRFLEEYKVIRRLKG